MIKTIIFDIGGVLLTDTWSDELRYTYAKFLRISERELGKVFEPWWLKLRVGKISENQYWQGMLAALGLEADLSEMRKIMRGSFKINDNVLKLAEKLRGAGYQLLALTNHGKEWLNFEKKKFGLDKLFDGFVTSFGVGKAKPNIAIYRWAIKEYNLVPAETIYIDDSQKNTQAAARLGFQTILFESTLQLEKDLRKLGVEV